MSSYAVYAKVLKYHKWKVLLYAGAVIGISVLIALQVQHAHISAVSSLESEMRGETRVILYQQLQNKDHLEGIIACFNSISFSVLSLVAMGTIWVLRVLQNEAVERRILYAPISGGRWNAGKVYISLLQIPFVWVVHMLLMVVLVGGAVFSFKGLMLLMNVFVLAIAGVGLAFMLIEMTREKMAVCILLHAVIFIMCFISGAFIPSYYFGNAAREFAAFTPVYWYVRANSLIRSFQFSELSALSEIIKCFGMQIVFGATFYILAAAVRKQKDA